MDLRLGTGDVPVLIRAWKLTDGVRAEAIVAGTHLEPLELRPKHFVSSRATECDRMGWPMVRGLPQRLGDGDCFGSWKDQAFEAFAEARFGKPSDRARKRTDAERAELSGLARQLKTLARDLAIHAADSCDPALRGLALRYPAGARLQIYAWLAGDPSGRLSAAAMSCPGPLLLAVGAIEYGLSRTVRAVLDGIRSGMPTREVVERAVVKWSGEARGRVLEHRELLAPALRIPRLSAEETAPMLAAQRSLVLCAGHGVPPSWVVTSPPLAFHPEDVPVRTRANAMWFKIMKTTAVARSGEPAHTELRRTLSSLLSRSGIALLKNLPRTWDVGDGVDALLEFVLERGLKLDSDTDLQRVLAEALPWYGTKQAADPSRGKYDRFRLYCAGRDGRAVEGLQRIAS